MSSDTPTTKKLLVAFDRAKPDAGRSDFLVPRIVEGRVEFFGLRSKRPASLGRMVYVGQEVKMNDLFARLVDTGERIASVDATVRMLNDYLAKLQEHKIGNVVAVELADGEPSGFRLTKIANTPSAAANPGG